MATFVALPQRFDHYPLYPGWGHVLQPGRRDVPVRGGGGEVQGRLPTISQLLEQGAAVRERDSPDVMPCHSEQIKRREQCRACAGQGRQRRLRRRHPLLKRGEVKPAIGEDKSLPVNNTPGRYLFLDGRYEIRKVARQIARLARP